MHLHHRSYLGRPIPAVGMGSLNLLAYVIHAYRMEETSSARVDEVGSKNLADINTVTQRTGKIGNAASFDDANLERLGATAIAALVDPCFIEAWVWCDDLVSNQSGIIFNFQTDSGTGRDFSVFVSQTGRLSVFFASATGPGTPGNVFVTGTGVITTGSWHQVLVGIVSGTVLAYVNGVSRSLSDGAAMGGGWVASLFVGATYTSQSFHLDGAIDEVRIFNNRALTQEIVDALWNAGAGVAFADLGGL